MEVEGVKLGDGAQSADALKQFSFSFKYIQQVSAVEAVVPLVVPSRPVTNKLPPPGRKLYLSYALHKVKVDS